VLVVSVNFCRRLEETQGRVQACTQTQEAGLQQGQIPRWQAAIGGNAGRRAQRRARDDIELCINVRL